MEARNTNKGILRRLENLQAFANRQRPAVMTVTLATGEKIVTDSAGAWDIYRDHTRREGVVSVTTDTPGYEAAARILLIACHPVEDRRIENYV